MWKVLIVVIGLSVHQARSKPSIDLYANDQKLMPDIQKNYYRNIKNQDNATAPPNSSLNYHPAIKDDFENRFEENKKAIVNNIINFILKNAHSKGSSQKDASHKKDSNSPKENQLIPKDPVLPNISKNNDTSREPDQPMKPSVQVVENNKNSTQIIASVPQNVTNNSNTTTSQSESTAQITTIKQGAVPPQQNTVSNPVDNEKKQIHKKPEITTPQKTKMKDMNVKLCGSKLSDMLKMICLEFNSIFEDEFSESIEYRRRRKRGVHHDCCEKPCKLSILKLYCKKLRPMYVSEFD